MSSLTNNFDPPMAAVSCPHYSMSPHFNLCPSSVPKQLNNNMSISSPPLLKYQFMSTVKQNNNFIHKHKLNPSINNNTLYLKEKLSLSSPNVHISSQQYILPIRRSTHPLDLDISPMDIQLIVEQYNAYQDTPNDIVYDINNTPIPNLLPSDLVELLTYDSPIKDSVMHAFLCALKSSKRDVFFLDTYFHWDLIHKGWLFAFHKYFLHESSSRHAKSTQFKPTLQASTIIIPIHINNTHLIAITRKIIDGITYFLYANDLNNENSYEYLKAIYSSIFTSHEFHPADSVWLNCGLRSLLAATIMALHPSPSTKMIIPFMHPNISQISRWWVAKSILSSTVNINPIQALFHPQSSCNDTMSLHREASPADLAILPLNHQETSVFSDPLMTLNSGFSQQSSFPNMSSDPNPTIKVRTPALLMEPKSPALNRTLHATSNPILSPTQSKTTTQCNDQRTIRKWTVHRPFIPNIDSGKHNTSSFISPSDPYQLFTGHLEPFGTP